MLALSVQYSNNKRRSVVDCKNWWVRFHVLYCKKPCRVDYQNTPFFCELLFPFVIIVGVILYQTKIFIFYQPGNKGANPGFVTGFFFLSFFLKSLWKCKKSSGPSILNNMVQYQGAWERTRIRSALQSHCFPQHELGNLGVPFWAGSVRQRALPRQAQDAG